MELSSQTYEGKVSMQGVSEVCLVKILLHCSSGAAGMGSIKPLGEQTSRKPHSTVLYKPRDQEMQALLCYRTVLPHLLDP